MNELRREISPSVSMASFSLIRSALLCLKDCRTLRRILLNPPVIDIIIALEECKMK